MTEAVLAVAFFLLLAFHAWQERQWNKEREMLVQRLQAPEQATLGYQVRQGERKPIPTLPYDDDSAFRAVKEKRDQNGNAG